MKIQAWTEHCSGRGPRTFRAEKPFLKVRPACSVKLIFSYVVKGIKIKITAKFRASRRLPFEDTKTIMPKCSSLIFIFSIIRTLDYPDYFVWSQRVRRIEVRLYLYNKQNITWPLGDTNFIFSC